MNAGAFDIAIPDLGGRPLCAESDPAVFFPEVGQQDFVRDAKAICARCPVIAACLAFALEHNETHGVWAGLTPAERHRLVRGRAA